MKFNASFLIAILFLWGFSVFAQPLYLNELVTSNTSVNTDEDGDFEDWVEIFNAGTEPLSLSGYGLSDNNNLFKWVFPDYIVQPGEYLIVWCSNKNRTLPDQPLHTNFAISAAGETITLTHPEGTIVDQIPAVVIPQNTSYGRETDGAENFIVFPVPTPGASNEFIEGSPGTALQPPNFSHAGGFFAQEFTLTLSHPDPEATILYTLDGSEPKAENLDGKTYFYKNSYEQVPGQISGELLPQTFTTLSYTSAIEILDRSPLPNKLAAISSTFHHSPDYLPTEKVFKGTVVRAKAIKDGMSPSQTITQTYFITDDLESRFSVPVVSISLDEEGFFDYEEGIYVAGVDFDLWRAENPDEHALWSNANYKRSGDITEKQAHFSYFENGQEILNQNIGVRIHGGFTRLLPNKSLRLYARSEYGNNSFDHAFFENYPFNSFKRLILRNSGNDAYATYFRDAFIQRMVSHLSFETQAYQPVITLINGEYFGMLNMRERFDRHYFERVFQIANGELDFLEYNGFLVQEGDSDHYADMLNFVANTNLQNNSNFNQLKTQMDTENFTDYFITNIYARNTDWPHNNIEFWRKRTSQYEPDAPYGQDGRWRWVLKDTDFGFGGDGGPQAYEHNTLAFATSTGGDESTNPEWSTYLLRRLLTNLNYKNYFINRFADLMNTSFLPERLTGIIDEMKSGIESEIVEHGQRWGSFSSLAEWQSHIDVMMEFSNQRTVHQRNHIMEQFSINSTVEVKLLVSDVSHGYIKINTIEIHPDTPGVVEFPYPWTGVYFRGIPITVKAIANPGFVFSHWSGASVSPETETTVTPNNSIQLKANFIPAPEVESEIPIYFWSFDNTLPNNTPLTEISASYQVPGIGTISFNSCMEGYPFSNGHPNWRKASMERRNSPTDINYIPKVNNNIPFEDADLRGLQIKQPFQQGGLENQVIFSFSTEGFRDILFSFAAKDEGAAEALILEYYNNFGEWIAPPSHSGIYELENEYQLFTVDLSDAETLNNQEEVQVRIRFAGSDMTIDEGNRVTFNNFAVRGTSNTFSLPDNPLNSVVFYPNPVKNHLYSNILLTETDYEIFSMDGKRVMSGRFQSFTTDLSPLQNGIYMIVVKKEEHQKAVKLIKK